MKKIGKYETGKTCARADGDSAIRLGVDTPGRRSSTGGNDEAVLLLGGFGRVRGEIPLVHLTRVVDECGEAVGYAQLAGAALLEHQEQREAFTKLTPKSVVRAV